MIRRRLRRQREAVFSFDSFLDIVANVVGVIIRLILVAWVGAKSYKGMQTLLPPPPAAVAETAVRNWEPPTGPQPLLPFQDADNRELAQAQARLLEMLRQMQQAQEDEQQTTQALAELAPRKEALRSQLTSMEKGPASPNPVALTLTDLRQRQQKVADEIQALQKLPAAKKALRYHAPVSEPVGAEEVFFECSNGRVTFIEIHTMLEEVKQRLPEKGELLKSNWQVTDATRQVGPFRLRYTVARQKGQYEGAFATSAPRDDSGFSFGVSAWQVEPMTPFRGETAAEALAAGSTFRRIAAALESQASVATFWVYSDSFELFRQLRDILYERGITVAGRPLRPGHPIGASVDGKRSRGQ